MKSLDSSGIIWVGVRQAGVLTDEVFHGQNTTHPAGVVAEEDTTKGREGTDQVGPHSDGGLEARRVRRAGNDNGCYSSSRHDGGDISWKYPGAVKVREVRYRREREGRRRGAEGSYYTVCVWWTRH